MVILCKERYRLELHWTNLNYLDGAAAKLDGAWFEGPVLKMAQKLEAPDFIDLDLTPQHLKVLDTYYIVRLSWQGVEYKDNKIILIGAQLQNDLLKSLHKLESGDSIVINTEKHEESLHPYNLVYESHVVRDDKKPYEYRK